MVGFWSTTAVLIVWIVKGGGTFSRKPLYLQTPLPTPGHDFLVPAIGEGRVSIEALYPYLSPEQKRHLLEDLMAAQKRNQDLALPIIEALATPRADGTQACPMIRQTFQRIDDAIEDLKAQIPPENP